MAHHGCCITYLPVSTRVSRIWQPLAAADSNHNPATKNVFHDQAMTVKFHLLSCVTLRVALLCSSSSRSWNTLGLCSIMQTAACVSSMQSEAATGLHAPEAKVCCRQDCVDFAVNGQPHFWQCEIVFNAELIPTFIKVCLTAEFTSCRHKSCTAVHS